MVFSLWLVWMAGLIVYQQQAGILTSNSSAFRLDKRYSLLGEIW
jgi:hypothetical protein